MCSFLTGIQEITAGGTMENKIRTLITGPLTESDGREVVEIFNHYIMHSDAAFLEEPVPDGFYTRMLSLLGSYPSASVRDESGCLIGFGMIRPHNVMSAFSHTAELTYFLRPGSTGAGIGSDLLRYLEDQGRQMGVTVLLAQISSKNEGSIRFHQRNGFVECGRFIRAGKKQGEYFDTVWMQKMVE